MNTSLLFELIQKYDVITIFRHVSPDSDALGSQFGLKQYIQDNYPNKKVYALGNNNGSKRNYFPSVDSISDEELSSSLAIILDTANVARIDDQRYILAAHKLKIDHHIIVETFQGDEIVADLFGATCEILGYMFASEHKKITSTCAQYLYSGLIADTLRYSIATTTSTTLKVGAYLLDAGVDVARANEENFSTSLKLYRYENFIRSNVTIVEDKLAYMIVNKEDYEAIGLNFSEAKEKVFVMGGVDEFLSWCLFVEKEKDEQGQRIYNGSLRSKNKTINDIANMYHGGGHRYACGVKGLREEDIQALLSKLLARIKE
ncbi:MAG: bifunctional oligoribonuclease/PAP phosphatase NrnA [Longicatena sp.]